MIFLETTSQLIRNRNVEAHGDVAIQQQQKKTRTFPVGSVISMVMSMEMVMKKTEWAELIIVLYQPFCGDFSYWLWTCYHPFMVIFHGLTQKNLQFIQQAEWDITNHLVDFDR